MHRLWARCSASESLSRCRALLAVGPLDAVRCHGTPTHCLAPSVRCCTTPALSLDTSTAHVAASCVQIAGRRAHVSLMPRSLPRAVRALARRPRVAAPSARCRAVRALPRSVHAAPLCIERCRWPHKIAQFTCCASEWINRIALIVGDHEPFLVTNRYEKMQNSYPLLLFNASCNTYLLLSLILFDTSFNAHFTRIYYFLTRFIIFSFIAIYYIFIYLLLFNTLY